MGDRPIASKLLPGSKISISSARRKRKVVGSNGGSNVEDTKGGVMEAIMPLCYQNIPKVEELPDRRCFAGLMAAFLSAASWGTRQSVAFGNRPGIGRLKVAIAKLSKTQDA